MAHVCDGVLHHGCLAVSVVPAGGHPRSVCVRRLPAPCTRPPTALRTLRNPPPGLTRQLDDRDFSYVQVERGRWMRLGEETLLVDINPLRALDAVLNGVALYVDPADGTVQSKVLVHEDEAGTEGVLKLGAVYYIRDGIRVPRPLLDEEEGLSNWTGPRILAAAPSLLAAELCVPQPRAKGTEPREPAVASYLRLVGAADFDRRGNDSALLFQLWVVAFAIVARGCAGRVMRLAAAWQMLRSVMQRICEPRRLRPTEDDPRVAWLVFLLKQERPEAQSLRVANALQLERNPEPTQHALTFSLDMEAMDAFVARVDWLQAAYPLPASPSGAMTRFALVTNVDPEGHFLYFPFVAAEEAVVSASEAAPYTGPRDIELDWRSLWTRKDILSVVAVVALLHLYRNPAWLRALECAQLRTGVTARELRGWGSILRRLVMPPPALLERCRTELHAAHNAAFNILQTSTEKGQPSLFALAMDLVQALRRMRWSKKFIRNNTRPDTNAPAALVPPDRAWHRCYLQNLLFALHEDWGHSRCEQCDRDAANAPYEPAAGPEAPNDTHRYLVLPEYALWCALGRDEATRGLAGVNNRAAAEKAVLEANLGARVDGKLRLFNRASAEHPAFL